MARSLTMLREAIKGKSSEQAERNAIGRLLLAEGWMGQPDVVKTKTADGRTVRVYRYQGTPFGDFSFIGGPDCEGEIVPLSQADEALAIATESGHDLRDDESAARQATVGAPRLARQEQRNPHQERDWEQPSSQRLGSGDDAREGAGLPRVGLGLRSNPPKGPQHDVAASPDGYPIAPEDEYAGALINELLVDGKKGWSDALSAAVVRYALKQLGITHYSVKTGKSWVNDVEVSKEMGATSEEQIAIGKLFGSYHASSNYIMMTFTASGPKDASDQYSDYGGAASGWIVPTNYVNWISALIASTAKANGLSLTSAGEIALKTGKPAMVVGSGSSGKAKKEKIVKLITKDLGFASILTLENVTPFATMDLSAMGKGAGKGLLNALGFLWNKQEKVWENKHWQPGDIPGIVSKIEAQGITVELDQIVSAVGAGAVVEEPQLEPTPDPTVEALGKLPSGTVITVGSSSTLWTKEGPNKWVSGADHHSEDDWGFAGLTFQVHPASVPALAATQGQLAVTDLSMGLAIMHLDTLPVGTLVLDPDGDVLAKGLVKWTQYSDSKKEMQTTGASASTWQTMWNNAIFTVIGWSSANFADAAKLIQAIFQDVDYSDWKAQVKTWKDSGYAPFPVQSASGKITGLPTPTFTKHGKTTSSNAAPAAKIDDLWLGMQVGYSLDMLPIGSVVMDTDGDPHVKTPDGWSLVYYASSGNLEKADHFLSTIVNGSTTRLVGIVGSSTDGMWTKFLWKKLFSSPVDSDEYLTYGDRKEQLVLWSKATPHHKLPQVVMGDEGLKLTNSPFPDDAEEEAVAVAKVGDTIVHPTKAQIDSLPVGSVVKVDPHGIGSTYTKQLDGSWQHSNGAVYYAPAFANVSVTVFSLGGTAPVFGAAPQKTGAKPHFPLPDLSSFPYSMGESSVWQAAGGDFDELMGRLHKSMIGSKLGSQEGGPITDPVSGLKFYVKFLAEERVKQEALACQLYRACSMPAPDARWGKIDGAWTFISPWNLDLQQIKAAKLTAEEHDALAKGFAIDAWLANWDVIGAGATKWDNLMMNPKSPPDSMLRFWRVDNGGCFDWKATGGKKPFPAHVVSELTTMLDPATNPTAAEAFKAAVSKPWLTRSVAKVLDENLHEHASAFGELCIWGGASQTLIAALKGRGEYINGWVAGAKEQQKLSSSSSSSSSQIGSQIGGTLTLAIGAVFTLPNTMKDAAEWMEKFPVGSVVELQSSKHGSTWEKTAMAGENWKKLSGNGSSTISDMHFSEETIKVLKLGTGVSSEPWDGSPLTIGQILTGDDVAKGLMLGTVLALTVTIDGDAITKASESILYIVEDLNKIGVFQLSSSTSSVYKSATTTEDGWVDPVRFVVLHPGEGSPDPVLKLAAASPAALWALMANYNWPDGLGTLGTMPAAAAFSATTAPSPQPVPAPFPAPSLQSILDQIGTGFLKLVVGGVYDVASVLDWLPDGTKVSKGNGTTLYEKSGNAIGPTGGGQKGVKSGDITIQSIPSSAVYSGQMAVILLGSAVDKLPIGSMITRLKTSVLFVKTSNQQTGDSKEDLKANWMSPESSTKVVLVYGYYSLGTIGNGQAPVAAAAQQPVQSAPAVATPVTPGKITSVQELDNLPIGAQVKVASMGGAQVYTKTVDGWMMEGGSGIIGSFNFQASIKAGVVSLLPGAPKASEHPKVGAQMTFLGHESQLSKAIMGSFPVGTVVDVDGSGLKKKTQDNCWKQAHADGSMPVGYVDWPDSNFTSETITVVSIPGFSVDPTPSSTGPTLPAVGTTFMLQPAAYAAASDQMALFPVGSVVKTSSGKTWTKLKSGEWQKLNGGIWIGENFEGETLTVLPIGPTPSASSLAAAPSPAAPSAPISTGILNADSWQTDASLPLGIAHPKGTWAWLVDPSSQRWLCWTAPPGKAGDVQVYAAAAARNLYSVLGARVPEGQLITRGGHPWLALKIPDGYAPAPMESSLDPVRPRLAVEFAADAWLANWTVIGPKSGMTFGIWLSPDGHDFIRVLFQGTFTYSYSGNTKAFPDNDIPEIKSMLMGSHNTSTAYAFADAATVDASAGTVRLNDSTFAMAQAISSLGRKGIAPALVGGLPSSFAESLRLRAKCFGEIVSKAVNAGFAAASSAAGVSYGPKPDSGPKTKDAAGLLLTDGHSIFLTKRAGWMKHEPNAWSIPSGSIEPNEVPIAAAKREFIEEVGGLPPKTTPTGIQFTAVYDDGRTFTTVVFYVPSSVSKDWQPQLHQASHKQETTGWTWVPIDEIETLMDDEGNGLSAAWKPKLHPGLAAPIIITDEDGKEVIAPLLTIWKDHAQQWAEAAKSQKGGAYGVDPSKLDQGVPFDVIKTNPQRRNPEGYTLSGVRSHPGGGLFIEYRPRLPDGTRPRIHVPIDSRTVAFAQVGQEFREAIKAKRLGIDYPLDEPLSPETSLVGTGLVTKTGKPIWPVNALVRFMPVVMLALGVEHPTAGQLVDMMLLEALGLPLEKATPQLEMAVAKIEQIIAEAPMATVAPSGVIAPQEVKAIVKAMPQAKAKLTKEQVKTVDSLVAELKKLLGSSLDKTAGTPDQKKMKAEIYQALNNTYTPNVNTEEPAGRILRILVLCKMVGLWRDTLDPGDRVVQRSIAITGLGGSFIMTPIMDAQIEAMIKAGVGSKADFYSGGKVDVVKAIHRWLECQSGKHSAGIGFVLEGRVWKPVSAKSLVPTSTATKDPNTESGNLGAKSAEKNPPAWAGQPYANVHGLAIDYQNFQYYQGNKSPGNMATVSHWTGFVNESSPSGFGASHGNKYNLIIRSRASSSPGFLFTPGLWPQGETNHYTNNEREVLHVDIHSELSIPCEVVRSELGGSPAHLTKVQMYAWANARPPYPIGWDASHPKTNPSGASTSTIRNPYPGQRRAEESTTVQSLLFDRGFYTVEQAKEWAAANGYSYGSVDVPSTGRFIHLRQDDPSDFAGIHTVPFGRGIKATVGHRR